MTRRSVARRELTKDVILIVFGAVLALVLSNTGTLDWIISLIGSKEWSSFISGIFFTSAFTLAPASVALARIAEVAPTSTVIIFGALGAMFGDLIIFLFIRDRFAADLTASLKPSFIKHILTSFHFGFLKWLAPFIGALIIASPLPDEFALGLLGISKTRVIVLMPVSFLMNIAGIYSLIWFAHII